MYAYGSAAAAQEFETLEALGGLAVESIKAVAKGVKRTKQRVKKWTNYRPARYKLLDCPEPEDVSAQWKVRQQTRDPLEALRFGAMLLNVSQDVDASPIYGRGKHIVARNPGLKGWLKSYCPEINYVTAMSYRKLAEVTCQTIKLPEFIPLEWVLPGTEKLDETRQLNPENKVSLKLKRGEILRQIRVCRTELSKLLKGAFTVNQLYAKLDERTQGHRHRLHIKITVGSLGTAAPQALERHLKRALELVQGMPEQTSREKTQELLLLLADLQEKLRAHSA